MISLPLLFAIVIVVLYMINSLNILKEYERGVIFRLGRVKEAAKGPGVIWVFRPLDQIVRISLRQEAMEVPPQDVITRDNVTLKVNAVITLRVVDPTKPSSRSPTTSTRPLSLPKRLCALCSAKSTSTASWPIAKP